MGFLAKDAGFYRATACILNSAKTVKRTASELPAGAIFGQLRSSVTLRVHPQEGTPELPF